MKPLEVLVRDKRNAQTFWVGFLDWVLFYEKVPRLFERVRYAMTGRAAGVHVGVGLASYRLGRLLIGWGLLLSWWLR